MRQAAEAPFTRFFARLRIRNLLLDTKAVSLPAKKASAAMEATIAIM
jgi:hypothetical protein